MYDKRFNNFNYFILKINASFLIFNLIINVEKIVSLGILGRKIGMTQLFDKSGNIIPVTLIKAGPCFITQIKTNLTNGYNAIQIGYGNVPLKSLNQPKLGH